MTISKPIILELGPEFYDAVQPASFPECKARFLNREKSSFLGLTDLQSEADWARRLHRFESWADNLPTPLTLRYHGHQFRHYNPDLGDGRGFLFAQFQGPEGKIYDLGTKGSGQTPYSRAGDGRLTLKGALRETLATEMLESLGVNTSKTFCFFETGERLQRNDEPSPTRSAVLTRMNHSHIRIGTFQRLSYFGERENILKLLNHCVQYYHPQLASQAEASSEALAALFLAEVAKKLAELAAQYMISGFVHGVLNTDNMNITGESFDHGPYRFLPHYDPTFTAAAFDQSGLYSYGRQPSAIYWNVVQLAGVFKTAFPEMKVEEKIGNFSHHFTEEVIRLFFHRLNLKPQAEDAADETIAQFFLFLSKTKIPYEQAFFDLSAGGLPERLSQSPYAKNYQSTEFSELQKKLRSTDVAEAQKLEHAYFKRSKPCTLLSDEIEELWKPIDEKDDWTLFHKKIEEIRSFRGLYKLYES